MALRTAGFLVLVTVLTGCGPRISPDELPALPEVGTASFLPAISDQLNRLTSAVTDDPLNAKKVGRLGMAYLAYSLNDSAETAFRRARALQPRAFVWMYYHAEALTRLGHYNAAVGALQDAIAKKPGYTPARIHLGQLWMQLGDLAAAGEQLQAVVDDMPDNTEARLALARFYLRADKPETARTHLEYLIDKVGPVGAVYFALGDAWRRDGDREKAGQYLALAERYRGVALGIEDPLMSAVTGLDVGEKPLLAEARRLNQLGKTDEAMEVLHRALARNPHSHLTHASLVGAYGAMKQFDKVDEHYQLALKSAPASAALLRNLGRARFYEKRYAEADAALKQALAIDPYDSSALTWLGLVRLQQRDIDGALELLAEALEYNPRESMARHNLANVLRRQGRHAEAVIHMQELLLAEDRQSPRVWRELGESYLQLGQVPAARDAFTAAVGSAERFGDDAEAKRSANLLQRSSQ